MSEDYSSNNQRIAKNTILLYGRMLFIMGLTFYTSRVVLNALGVEDYGIYNVVGGIVSMFAFLEGALVTTTQRYITFNLGKGDEDKLRTVFSTCILVHAILAIFISFLCETVGMWFFYNKMNIPEARMGAAMWVFQISIVTMIVSIMSAPYNAIIIAHERMNVFAIISIFGAVLKLALVFLLLIGDSDRLILYAILMLLVQIITRIIYTHYCKKHFNESYLTRDLNKPLIIEIAKFAGWNVWGNVAATLYGTGVNLLLNVFFGPIVNAARGIAVEVESSILKFVTSFLMATNPQITKLYAQENIEEMHLLLFRACKFCCYLVLLFTVPIMIETDAILTLWLKQFPEYTVSFVKILMFIVLVDAVARPLMTAAAATGNVRKYQTVVGGLLLSIFPLAYIVLKLGGDPLSVYVVHLAVYIVAFIARLFIIRPLINLSIRQFFVSVILPCAIVTGMSYGISYLIKGLMPSSILASLTTCMICVLVVCIVAYVIGLTTRERNFVNEKAISIIRKIKK